MNVGLYLRRLGLDRPAAPDLASLCALHDAHVRTVPFENMSILEGRGVSLAPEDLADAVLHRGGYCFTLNGAFALLLEALGYQVERLLGRVWFNGSQAPPPTHQALRVMVDGRPYLCDVGFGGLTMREPLPWTLDAPVDQGPDAYRLTAIDNSETLVEARTEHGWVGLYSLLPATFRPQDYLPANHYASTHPASFFTRAPVLSRCTLDGRVSLRDRTVRRTGASSVDVRELHSAAEFEALVRDAFAIEPTPELRAFAARYFAVTLSANR